MIFRAFVPAQEVDLVCLQETKLQEMSDGIIRSLGGSRCTQWSALNSRGAAGGIVVFWDSRVLHMIDVEEGTFSISCRFRNYEDDFLWCFIGVYGPTTFKEREGLWNELGAIRGLWNDPWCMAGDFNITKFSEERSGEGRLTGGMRRFSNVIEDLELRDLPLQGGPFMWSGGLNNLSKSRLDHFLISEDWEEHFGGFVQSVLPRPISDHFPILLDGGE